jgi:hypothetical protein
MKEILITLYLAGFFGCLWAAIKYCKKVKREQDLTISDMVIWCALFSLFWPLSIIKSSYRP